MATNFEELIDQLRHFDIAQLVTQRTDNSLAGRPLAIAEVTRTGNLWFITHADSSVIRDITENSKVAACLQQGKRFVTISGVARMSREREKIDQLWDPSQGIWFDKGKRDPELVLLEIVPEYGEYWDRSGARGIDFGLRSITAMLTGNRLPEGTGAHGAIKFDNGHE